MATIALSGVDALADAAPAQRGPHLMSLPDAERLGLQSRFVKSQVEAEILRDIEDRIRRATLLEPSAVPADLVTMNSQVALRDVDTGRRYILTLAFPACANAQKGQVSVLTPLGSILLGARAGQKLICPISGVMATVVVEAILRQPEAAGDYYG